MAPKPLCQLARAAQWPRTTTGLRRNYASATPQAFRDADTKGAGSSPCREESGPSQSSDDETGDSRVITLPPPPLDSAVEPEAFAAVDPSRSSRSQPVTLAPNPSVPALEEHQLRDRSISLSSSPPLGVANPSSPSEPPKRSRIADASSSAPTSLRPSAWRPPFPLPTDLATIMFRIRSLYVSTSHLVRERLGEAFLRLRHDIGSTKATLEEERVRLLTAGKLIFGQVGGRVNSVTGYDGIERLKESVRTKEDALTDLRMALSTAKTTYHQTISLASSSQRELNDLLQRKHSWSSSDVERFTLLVREDHQSSSAATHAKEEVEGLEIEADRAFEALMRAILQRYHEEQTWSDKLRSLSSYTQLLVLGVNALLFLGAVAVVEPWKRRRMVEGFEGRVREMTTELGSTFRAEVEMLRQEVAAGSKATLGASLAAPPTGQTTEPEASLPALTLADDPAALPPPSVAHLFEPAASAQPSMSLFLPHSTFPYHYPSPALLALPNEVAVAVKDGCIRAWKDPRSSERALAFATGVGMGVGALAVGLCKG